MITTPQLNHFRLLARRFMWECLLLHKEEYSIYIDKDNNLGLFIPGGDVWIIGQYDHAIAVLRAFYDMFHTETMADTMSRVRSREHYLQVAENSKRIKAGIVFNRGLFQNKRSVYLEYDRALRISKNTSLCGRVLAQPFVTFYDLLDISNHDARFAAYLTHQERIAS